MKKNLAYLVYSVTSTMFNYLKDKDFNQLIIKLNGIELFHRLAFEVSNNDERSIWFKFGKDDTIVTTIKDIERDLSLPVTHGNYKLMIEKFELVTSGFDPDNELRVYFS